MLTGSRFDRFGLLAATAAALLVCGCQKAPDPTGSWTGTISKPSTSSASAASPAVPLEVRKDGTFTMGESMTAATGSWKMANGTLSLTIVKLGSMDVAQMKKAMASQFGTAGKSSADSVDKPIDLKLSSDGKTLTGSLSFPGQPSLSVSFTKNES